MATRKRTTIPPPPLHAAGIYEGVPREDLLSTIRGLLTPEQIQVAAWFAFDGLDHGEIAQRLPAESGKGLGVSRVAVTRRMKRINDRLASAGLPALKQLRHEYYGRGAKAEGQRPPERNVLTFTKAEDVGYRLRL